MVGDNIQALLRRLLHAAASFVSVSSAQVWSTSRSRSAEAGSGIGVCMYTPSASGGHARYTHELLAALSQAGRDQSVRVSLVTSRDLAPEYRSPLYPIHDVLPPLLPRAAYRSVLSWGFSRLVHYRKRERAFLRWVEGNGAAVDGVHFQEYTPWLAPVHLRYLRARGKCLFFTVHNVYPHKSFRGILNARSLLLLLNRFCILVAWRLCDGLFVHSEGLREELAERLGAGHPPIFVVPHGVWKPADGAPAGVAAEERARRRRLLFFGVMRRNKGLDVLLRAMEGLDDCALTVAGSFHEEPGYRERVRALAGRLPPGRVELIDEFVEDDEAARLFGRSTLVVLPYTSFAAQSGVLHDALAHGLPVVVTDVGALGESVRRWGVGRVVPPGDAAALAGAVREMLEPGRYARASRAAERARGDLSWGSAAQATVGAYRSVMQRWAEEGGP